MSPDTTPLQYLTYLSSLSQTLHSAIHELVRTLPPTVDHAPINTRRRRNDNDDSTKWELTTRDLYDDMATMKGKKAQSGGSEWDFCIKHTLVCLEVVVFLNNISLNREAEAKRLGLGGALVLELLSLQDGDGQGRGYKETMMEQWVRKLRGARLVVGEDGVSGERAWVLVLEDEGALESSGGVLSGGNLENERTGQGDGSGERMDMDG